MLGGLFKKLFGNPRDPSRDWPPGDGQLPTFDLGTCAWGTLKFGDDVDSARFLGKPDEFREITEKNWCILDYARWGFSIEFFNGEFDAMYVLIGEEGEFLRKPTDPMQRVRLSNGVLLSKDSNPDDVIRCFGEPDHMDDPDDEFFDENSVMLTYENRPIEMEFEFNQHARLVLWHMWRKRSEDA